MNIYFIKSSEKKKILQELNEEFGIEKIPYLLIWTGKEKIRAFSGHLAKEEIMTISRLTNIEIIGLYFGKKENNEKIRLSLDTTHILKDQIKNKIVEINEQQLQEWLRGHDLQIQTEKGNVIIKYEQDLMGCGKSTGEKIFNYVPKDRRLKK